MKKQLSLDALPPIEAPAGGGNDEVKDGEGHEGDDNSQFGVLHAHRTLQISRRTLKSHCVGLQ